MTFVRRGRARLSLPRANEAARGLIAKIPRSRRWRVSLSGRRTMTSAIKLREVAYPSLFAIAAAA